MLVMMVAENLKPADLASQTGSQLFTEKALRIMFLLVGHRPH